MAEIINLRIARKARTRAADKALADANRAKHGQSLAEKSASRAESTRIDRIVDGAKRIPPPSPDRGED